MAFFLWFDKHFNRGGFVAKAFISCLCQCVLQILLRCRQQHLYAPTTNIVSTSGGLGCRFFTVAK